MGEYTQAHGSGALYVTNPGAYYNNRSTQIGAKGIGFDASKSNKIFGASLHVESLNLTIKIWKRID